MNTIHRLEGATFTPYVEYNHPAAIERYNNAKASYDAAIAHAAEMVDDGVISFDEAAYLVAVA